MNFKNKVQSMTAKEIIVAMVNGLRNEYVRINMNSYGEVENGICYGCAATNTICEISGKVFTADNINELYQRVDFLDTDVEFLKYFEFAIDSLIEGDFEYYNELASDYGFAEIINYEGLELPELTNDSYLENLHYYEALANIQN